MFLQDKPNWWVHRNPMRKEIPNKPEMILLEVYKFPMDFLIE